MLLFWIYIDHGALKAILKKRNLKVAYSILITFYLLCLLYIITHKILKFWAAGDARQP